MKRRRGGGDDSPRACCVYLDEGIVAVRWAMNALSKVSCGNCRLPKIVASDESTFRLRFTLDRLCYLAFFGILEQSDRSSSRALCPSLLPHLPGPIHLER